MRTHDDILRDRHVIDERIRAALRKANEDAKPELDALQAECASLGHHNRGTQHNMLGNRSHKECGYCGASYDWQDVDI